MKITIESTDVSTQLDGVVVRVWEGGSEHGTRCKVFVQMIVSHEDDDSTEFARDLRAMPLPHEAELLSILMGQAEETA